MLVLFGLRGCRVHAVCMAAVISGVDKPVALVDKTKTKTTTGVVSISRHFSVASTAVFRQIGLV